jgi:hypothetical protein
MSLRSPRPRSSTVVDTACSVLVFSGLAFLMSSPGWAQPKVSGTLKGADHALSHQHVANRPGTLPRKATAVDARGQSLNHPSVVAGKPQFPASSPAARIQGASVRSFAVGRGHSFPAVIGGPAPFNGKNGSAIGTMVIIRKH